jgi:hypothetical protein
MNGAMEPEEPSKSWAMTKTSSPKKMGPQILNALFVMLGCKDVMSRTILQQQQISSELLFRDQKILTIQKD